MIASHDAASCCQFLASLNVVYINAREFVVISIFALPVPQLYKDRKEPVLVCDHFRRAAKLCHYLSAIHDIDILTGFRVIVSRDNYISPQ